MNWAKGYTAKYIARLVDRASFNDMEEIPIISGSISRDITSNLLESATIETHERIDEQWVRIYMIATQNGGSERIPLFTGLASSPARDINGVQNKYSIDLYSVLKPAADWMVPLGYYLPSGVQGETLIKALFDKVGIRMQSQLGSGVLTAPIVAEAGETYLSLAMQVLKAIGWYMYITGDGQVQMKPYETEPVTTFDTEHDAIEPEIRDSKDMFSCPNVLRVTAGNYTTTVKDENSIRDRGREIWAQEKIDLISGTSLTAYAMSRLAELQSPSRELEYTRRFHPDVRPGDAIRITCPRQQINGIFRVQNQKITLGYGARTEEVVHES